METGEEWERRVWEEPRGDLNTNVSGERLIRLISWTHPGFGLGLGFGCRNRTSNPVCAVFPFTPIMRAGTANLTISVGGCAFSHTGDLQRDESSSDLAPTAHFHRVNVRICANGTTPRL